MTAISVDDMPAGFKSAWQRINDAWEADQRQRDGAARQALWGCKDGWIVGYTTTRVVGGPHDGGFVAMAYKPTGKGARTGKATEHQRVYIRRFATRKAARARAERLYDQHS